MDDHRDRALSFGRVASAYDRARPSYPVEAARWLTGSSPLSVLELGAGTGKLTDVLLGLGHDVLATDPLEEMLSYLRLRHPECRTATGTAEDIPAPSRSVDVVVAAQAFHWFSLDRALPEIARVLKPEGTLALVWNVRDDRIPWVRRFGQIVDKENVDQNPVEALVSSRIFGFVEEESFRFWQQLRRAGLRDLVSSRSDVSTMGERERERILSQVDGLFDEYERDPGGLLMPYLTRCFKAVVRPVVLEDTGPIHLDGGVGSWRDDEPPEDDATPLFTLS